MLEIEVNIIQPGLVSCHFSMDGYMGRLTASNEIMIKFVETLRDGGAMVHIYNDVSGIF